MTEKRFEVYKVIGSFHEWCIEDNIDDKVVFGSIMHKYEADRLCDKLNALNDKYEQLKKELKVYHKVARCSNCKYHDYDWDIDDGYGGEEYEVCDKGNDVTDGICEEWEEL